MSVDPLTSAEQVDIRRFCGYPPTMPPGVYDPIIGALAVITDDYINVVRTTYLANLYILEAAIPAATAKLAVDQAGPFKRNAAELQERSDLFRSVRLQLCWLLGIQSGPFLNMLIPAGFVAR